MKFAMMLLLLTVFSFTAFGQSEKRTGGRVILLRDEYSSVYDIRNFEKFYLQIDIFIYQKFAPSILEVLKREPSIRPIKRFRGAQFVVGYSELDKGCRMQVYYVEGDRRITVWTEERSESGKAEELAEEFLKVLRHNKKLDVPDEPGDAD